MIAFITTAALGLIISVLGIINMTGNISSLHWYHRQRVSEADRLAFGRLVGLGTLIIGISVMLFGVLTLVSELTGATFVVGIATALLLICVAVGMAVSFYAMKKYNGGIF